MLRNDSSFASKKYLEHQKGDTPLLQLPIGHISQFPIDYMHNVCIGVVKKLLFIWRDSGRQYGLRNININSINLRIFELKAYWPRDFNRKPRTLTD